MIRFGADYEKLSSNGLGALSMTCAMIRKDRDEGRRAHPGRLRVIRRLLQVGVDPNAGCPLQYACA
jgi:hypothetical protein